jgi:hypothetical protein
MSDDSEVPPEKPTKPKNQTAVEDEEPYNPPPGLGPDFVRKITGKPNKRSR